MVKAEWAEEGVKTGELDEVKTLLVLAIN